MKPRIVAIGVVSLCMSGWSLNKNQSVEFLQTQNRNASTSTDAVFHNPAGVAFLPGNGLHLSVGNQLVLQNPTVKEDNPVLNAYGPGTYEGNVDIWLFPTVHAAYRMDDWSLFLHAAPLAGGGEGVYDQGIPMFDNMIMGFASGIGAMVKPLVEAGYGQQLSGTPFAGQQVTTGSSQAGFQYQRNLSFTGDIKTLSFAAGTAYRILPTLSASVAYRFAYASNTYKGSARPSRLGVVYQGSQGLAQAGISGASVDSAINAAANHVIDSLWQDIEVDVVQTGVAHGAILGLDFKPNEIWNIGLRFEWNGEMELENTESTLKGPALLMPYLAIYEKGAKSKATEPMVVAAGVAFTPMPSLTLESSLTYGLSESVDHDGAEKFYHDSYYGGIGARWRFTDRIEAALGYTYDATFKDNAVRSEIEPDLPTHYASTGLNFQATPRLRIETGAMLGTSLERHGTSAASGRTLTFDTDHLGFGLGLNWSPEI